MKGPSPHPQPLSQNRRGEHESQRFTLSGALRYVQHTPSPLSGRGLG